MSRIKVEGYKGIYYRMTKCIGGKSEEKVFYAVWKDKNGKVHEERCGRQFKDDMTPAKAATIRGKLIEGERLPRTKQRELDQAAKQAFKNRWTVSKLFEEYKAQNLKLKGLSQDQNRFDRHLKNDFGDKEPKEIVPLDVDRLRVSLGKKYAPATVRNTLELLRRMVNFGVERQLCEGLSFKIKMPTVDNIRTEMLSQDELKALLKVLNEEKNNIQAANLMKLCLFTGMRRSELFRLEWRDLDFENGFITLRDPKGTKTETIPMNPFARDLLKDHPRKKSKGKKSLLVFPGRGGKKRTDISKAANALKERAGLPADFRPLHGLRHAYASMLASSGQVDLYTLQKLMTHKSPQMVQRYAHLANEALQRAGNVAAGIFLEASESQKEKAVKLKERRK